MHYPESTLLNIKSLDILFSTLYSPNVGGCKISPKLDKLLPHTGGDSFSQREIQGIELLMYGMQAL